MQDCFKLYYLNFNIADEAPAAKKKEDVHVPAKNIGDIKSAEKVQTAPIPLTYMYTYRVSSKYYHSEIFFNF